ncbi:acyl-CoA dehydrogenase family protein (plasmid) [Cupriavidus basilensis]
MLEYLDDEQRMLANAVERQLERTYDFAARRRNLTAHGGFDPAHWASFADMGLLGLNLPDLCGGAGLGTTALYPVMEAFGRHLVVEPYVTTAVLCGQLIATGATEVQKLELLPQIATGKRLFAFAHGEAQTDYALHNVSATATRQGDHWILDGTKIVVSHGGIADALIVSARTSGETKATDGISLFLVERTTLGLQLESYPSIDATGCADIHLSGVRLAASRLLGEVNKGYHAISQAADMTAIALCAEAVGAMSAVLDLTLAYVKTRQQFGKAIGTFQVIQHRMAEMLITLEQARSLAWHAAVSLDEAARSSPATCQQAISAAKIKCAESGRFIGQQGVHLHGGMGMTDELPVGHYVRRLLAIEHSQGDASHHLSRYAALAVA